MNWCACDPRRVYTQSHADYVGGGFETIAARKASLRGMKIVWQTERCAIFGEVTRRSRSQRIVPAARWRP